ncbi:MAG: hypothetical protein AAF387_09845 [Pseudomonadota bacterium]
MSVSNVERVLWEFSKDPARIAKFTATPDAYLSNYVLSEDERDALCRGDLKSLADMGVNTLLTLTVWPLINGPEGMPFSYLEHMNGGKLPGRPA